VGLNHLRFVMGQSTSLSNSRFIRRMRLHLSSLEGNDLRLKLWLIVSAPPARRLRSRGRELLASDRNLIGLVVPSSAPSRRASEGYSLRITTAIERWWLCGMCSED